MATWLERIRNVILGNTVCELREENKQLREHLLKLSGYLQPQIEVLAPQLPVSELKEISATKVQPRRRAMSWPQWAREREQQLDEQRVRNRVAQAKS